MIKLLHELKNSSCYNRSIQAFDNVSAGKKENQKFAELLYITKNRMLTCVLSRFDLAKRSLRQTVQPHTFCARLLAFDKTLAKPHYAVVNCSDAGMSVFYSPVLTRRLIFLQL